MAQEIVKLEGTISELEQIIGDISLPSGSADFYDGAYEVTPRLYEEQVLETAQKRMRSNVTVFEIPVTQTTNPYGGLTVVIG